MKTKDVLFKQTILRVGYDQMKGVERLVEEGHYGLAEKHTVAKLLEYVKGLEERLGIRIPDLSTTKVTPRLMKITSGGISYYAPSASGA